MGGMLSNFLRNRRRQKLIEEIDAQERPAPEVFAELVQMLREDGDFQAASRVAKRGAELHPDSAKMLQSRADMERVIRDLEKERIRQKIQSYPSPALFARLAELYKVDGEVEAAIRVCQKGISDFPSYGGCYLVLGEICLENGDYAGARVHLEKSAEQDKYNYTALRRLADVYMHLGMPDQAARRLEEIMGFAPGDEGIREMLRQARSAAGEPPPEPVTTAEYVGSAEEPAGTLVEDDTAEADVATAADRQTDLNKAIGMLMGVTGVDGALLVDPYGLVIASHMDGRIDEELAGAMITNIFRAVARNAETMGIGAFEEGLIEGEGGNVHIMGLEDMILAVFAQPTVKMGMLDKTIRDFADRVVG